MDLRIRFVSGLPFLFLGGLVAWATYDRGWWLILGGWAFCGLGFIAGQMLNERFPTARPIRCLRGAVFALVLGPFCGFFPDKIFRLMKFEQFGRRSEAD